MAKRREFFLTGATSRITGVTPRNLDYWAKTKFIVPSVAEAKGTGTERKYAFNDLVALRIARQLRQAGISTQALRGVVKRLRSWTGANNPLAESHLVVIGSDVKLVSNCTEVLSLLSDPGQASFAFMVDLIRTVKEIKIDIKANRAA
jgi:DNA-binding transcriptional MerR regulator